MTDMEALAAIKQHIEFNRGKNRVFLSRQFYNTTKHLKFGPNNVETCLRINENTGKLQVWEGKSSGGWIDVIGKYRVTLQGDLSWRNK